MSRIAFCWTNGIKHKDRFDRWNDGLRAALRLIEAEHEVTYHEPDEVLPTVDWILYWEAGCTMESPEDGHKYRAILNSPQKKALLFAGGPVKEKYFQGFDHIFVESKINKDEFDALGMKNSTAFGVNTDIFFPINDADKKFTTVTHGACAGWKRQHLVGQALKEKALVFGQYQASDPYVFEECRKNGATVMPEQTYEETNRLLNSASVSVNCADYWGGGQRATLEAMACDIPVVVMSDSPKNREYVEESECGYIVNPDPQSIVIGVHTALQMKKPKSRDYIMSKWTPEHYKNAILNVIS